MWTEQVRSEGGDHYEEFLKLLGQQQEVLDADLDSQVCTM